MLHLQEITFRILKKTEKVRNTVLNDSESEPSTSKRRRTDDSKRQIAIEVSV
jgi:hypothetical protein